MCLKMSFSHNYFFLIVGSALKRNSFDCIFSCIMFFFSIFGDYLSCCSIEKKAISKAISNLYIKLLEFNQTENNYSRLTYNITTEESY